MSAHYFSRSVSRRINAEYPVGDPFDGPAYGRMTDVGTAVSAGASLVGGMMSGDSASDAAGQSAEASKYAADIQKKMYDQTRTDQEPWRLGGQSALYKLLNSMGLNTADGGYFGNPVSETREQILARMTPSYTTTTTNATAQAPNFTDETGASFYSPFYALLSGGGAGAGGGSTNTSSVDSNALNAAVDAEYARQSALSNGKGTPSGFGDLSKKFSIADYQADPGYAFRVAEGQRGLNQSAAAAGGLQSGNALKAAARYGQEMGSQEYGNAYNRFNNDQSTQYNRLSNIAGFGQTANNSLASSGANYANQAGNYAMTNGANQGNAALASGNSRASSWTGLGKALGGYDWSGKSGGSGGGFGGDWIYGSDY